MSNDLNHSPAEVGRAAHNSPNQNPNPAPMSLVAAQRKNQLGPAILLILGAAGIAVFIYFKNTALKNVESPANVRIASSSRKPVPELKVIAPPQPVAPPAAAPEPVATDPLQLFRDQQEMQRLEKARVLREARLKSALEPAENTIQSAIGGLTGTEQGNALGLNLPALPDYPASPQGLTEVNREDKNLQFANASSGKPVAASKAAALSDLGYKILQGKVIEAITLSRAVSDLPGMMCALTQRDVYAERGRQILIPWGSRLCGVYNAEVRKGQNRLFAIWNTLRVAHVDGSVSEVQLDSIGSDQLGTAGMGGIVDTHFAEIFGTAAMLSIIGAGAANAGPTGPDQNFSATQYRLSVQQAAAQTAQSVLAPYIQIPPTITVPAGSKIRIFVNRDLDFSSLLRTDARSAQTGM